jgi:hypothetical protein
VAATLFFETSLGLSLFYHAFLPPLRGGHLIVLSPCCKQRMLSFDDGVFCKSCNRHYVFSDRYRIRQLSATRSNNSMEQDLVNFLVPWVEQFKNPLEAVIEADNLATLINHIQLEKYESLPQKKAKKWAKKNQRVVLSS